MERSHFRVSKFLCLAAVALMLVGCNSSNRLSAERNALWQENQQLRGELTRAQQDRNQAIANQSALNDRLAQMNAALTAANNKPPITKVIKVEVPVAAPPTRTGFDNIDGIETENRADRIIVRVPGDVLFASGKVDLKSTSQKTLAQIASVIRSDYSSKLVRVEGYTDSDPIRRSQWKDNLELSMQRAASVHRYLQSQGLDAKKMYAAGFGPANPRSTKTKSRRVEIVVVLNEQMASGR